MFREALLRREPQLHNIWNQAQTDSMMARQVLAHLHMVKFHSLLRACYCEEAGAHTASHRKDVGFKAATI